jgi:hypothetical protein
MKRTIGTIVLCAALFAVVVPPAGAAPTSKETIQKECIKQDVMQISFEAPKAFALASVEVVREVSPFVTYEAAIAVVPSVQPRSSAPLLFDSDERTSDFKVINLLYKEDQRQSNRNSLHEDPGLYIRC